MADLGMQLARRAAADALAEPAQTEAPRTEPAEAAPAEAAPANDDRQPTAAPTAALAAPAAPRLSLAPLRPVSSARLFTLLCACVRATIALEMRLTATGTATVGANLRNDPRRAILYEGFRQVTEHDPDRKATRREAEAHADAALNADPAQTKQVHTLFWAICHALNIQFDPATLDDVYIDMGDDEDEEDPNATGPP